MTQPFDINTIIATILSSKYDGIVDQLVAVASKTTDQTRARMRTTYRHYLRSVLLSYSSAKSFLSNGQVVPIYDFFVPMQVAMAGQSIVDATLDQLMSIRTRIAVTGSGGCGKSILMRHLLVQCVEQGERVPVLLEFRDLAPEHPRIMNSILRELSKHGLEVGPDYLRIALERDQLCVLIDGFDELPVSERGEVLREVDDLSSRHPGIWIVATSRSGAGIDGLRQFTVLPIMPLTRDKATELVQLAPFDKNLKARFLEDLDARLFDEHPTFTSNPLLLSIMLLTYQSVANIPHRLNLFFDHAFDALFERHDAKKGGFVRQRRTALDIQDFRSALARFCIWTYLRQEYSFTRVSILDRMLESQELGEITYDCSAFLDDCIESVCLLIDDAGEVSFVHRSFQEYFAAQYIAQCSEELKSDLLAQCAERMESDIVLELLWSMDRQTVENHFVLPHLDTLFRVAGEPAGDVGLDAYYAHLIQSADRVTFHPKDAELVIAHPVAEFDRFSQFVEAHYGDDLMNASIVKASDELVARATGLAMLSNSTIAPNVLDPKGAAVEYLSASPGILGIARLNDLLTVRKVVLGRQNSRNACMRKLLKTPVP